MNLKLCFNVFNICIKVSKRIKLVFFYLGNNIYIFYKDSCIYICIMNIVINMFFVVFFYIIKIVEKEFDLYENESK